MVEVLVASVVVVVEVVVGGETMPVDSKLQNSLPVFVTIVNLEAYSAWRMVEGQKTLVPVESWARAPPSLQTPCGF